MTSMTMKRVRLAGLSLLLISASAFGDEPAKPNDARAEAAGRKAGEIAGAVAGGLAGAATGGRAGELAGATAGSQVGGEAGAAAGRVLDQHADANRASGRGGPDDPRYNPMSLFDR